jgi:autotransporter translocation and assembly factor TamB
VPVWVCAPFGARLGLVVRLRRYGKRVGLVLGALVALCALLVAAAVVVLQGETLAAVVRKVIPPLKGKIELRAAHWRARALVDLLTNRPTPITVDGLRFVDPEGTVVLDVAHLETRVPLRSALKGKIYLHDLTLSPASLWRFGTMRDKPGIGFVEVFVPASRAEPPAVPAVPTLPPPRPPPDPDPFVFKIVNVDLAGLNAVFDFTGWGFELRNMHGLGSLDIDGEFVGWEAHHLTAREGSSLRITHEVLPFDHVEVSRAGTTRDWPDHIFMDLQAARTGRSSLKARGFYTHIYGYRGARDDPGIDMTATVTEAADAVGAVMAAHGIPGFRVSGKGTRLDVTLGDIFDKLKVTAVLSGLDVGFGRYEARGLALKGKMNLDDPLRVSLSDLSFSAPGGGKLFIGASLTGTAVETRWRFDRFATAGYLPSALHQLAAGRLSGRLSLSGDFGAHKKLAVQVAGLDFARSRGHALPPSVQVTGHASASGGRLFTEGIRIAVPGADAELRGEVQLARRLVSIGLRASTSDLPQLLSSLGVQPLARGAALSVQVDGKLAAPQAHGEVVLHGIGIAGLPEVPQLATRFRLEDGILHVDTSSPEAYGGRLEGHGQMKVFEGTLAHLAHAAPVSFRLEGHDVELALLMALGWASGKISFVATATGPLDHLRAHVEIPAGSTVQVFGAPWELRGIDVDLDERSVVVRTAQLGRASGARIAVEGRMEFGGSMAWRLALHDVAIEGLPGLAGLASGRLSADLTAGGTLARPALAGTISLAGVTVRGTRLGDGHLVLEPLGNAGVTLKGNLFHRLDVQASASFGSAGPRVSAQVAFQGLALEDLLPELVALGDGRGRASGRISLELHPDGPLTVEARLSELEASIIRRSDDGASQRIWFRNAGDLHGVLVGDHLVLDEARLVTDGGEFRIKGELAGQAVRGSLAGHLDLDLLQPFLQKEVRKLTGDLSVELAVAGTTTRPDLQGTLAIEHPVVVRPVAFASEVTVPSGRMRFEGRNVALDDLAITVDDATLTLRGRARYDERFTPTSFDLDAAGELSARVIEALAEQAVSDASGRLKLRAHVGGTPADPRVNAHVELGAMEMHLRNLGRLLNIEGGTIDLDNKELVLRNVKTRVDDQGRLYVGAGADGPGRVVIKSLFPRPQLGAVDVPIKGEHLSYRIPGTAEIDDVGFSLGLTGDPEEGLELGGEVLIASGRYVQDFAVQDLVLKPRFHESSARPFWEGQPWLEQLALDLRVRSVGDTFVVQNNLAPELYMILDLHVGGTLSEPRLAGNIRPTDGRFHILGLRGDFELVPNANHVAFVETKSIADGDTPELNLEAQNMVPDSAGNEHNVRIRITGPIGQAAIDLSSDDGLDRNQALMLLVSGRLGRDGSTQSTSAAAGARGSDLAGQISRDTVSSLVEPYIDDTLQLLTGRQLNLRPTVGADGFELKLSWRYSRKIDAQLSYLRGFQSDAQQRYRAEANVWVVDYFTLRGFYQRLTLSPQQGITEDISSLNAELTLDFPLRFSRP